MKSLIWLVVALVLIMLVISVLKAKQGGTSATGKARGEIKARRILSRNEERMFWRLCETFKQPEYSVFSQVAFAALVTTSGRDRATRNTFDRKFADFVLCDKALTVIAVIELDDSTHNGREVEDKARESLLTEAGYRVVRYTQVPDQARLIEDLRPGP